MFLALVKMEFCVLAPNKQVCYWTPLGSIFSSATNIEMKNNMRLSVRLSITSRGQNQLQNVVYTEDISTNG
jgi:hypothetical protein